MSELFEIVKERPDNSLNKEIPSCPCCERNIDVVVISEASTLVGNLDGKDVNHHWLNCYCHLCEDTFVFEHKKDNCWITKNKKILKGIPSCFEDYIYTCNECNGKVRREYTQLDGETPVQILKTIKENGEWKKKYRTFFSCEICGKTIETDEEYYEVE